MVVIVKLDKGVVVLREIFYDDLMQRRKSEERDILLLYK
jgi:hypothetical protein